MWHKLLAFALDARALRWNHDHDTNSWGFCCLLFFLIWVVCNFANKHFFSENSDIAMWAKHVVHSLCPDHLGHFLNTYYLFFFSM